MQKVVFDMADGSFTETFRINQTYARDFLFYLTYVIKKGEVEEIEQKFQDNLRKAKKGK
jgi:transposase